MHLNLRLAKILLFLKRRGAKENSLWVSPLHLLAKWRSVQITERFLNDAFTLRPPAASPK